mgnify:CR=1 FL=1
MIYLIIDNKIKFNVSNYSNTQLLNLIEQLENNHSIYLKRIVK